MRIKSLVGGFVLACAAMPGVHACDAEQGWHADPANDALGHQARLTVESLQTRTDSDALLVRLLLTPFEPGDQAARRAELATRALEADDADALVLYRVLSGLSLELPKAVRDSAMRRLLQMDADNLAAALLAMPADDPAFDEWLRSARATTRFDAYFEQTVLLLMDAATAAPQDAEFVAAVAAELGDHGIDAELAHAVPAFGISAAMGTPNLQPLFQRCDPNRAETWSPQRESGCMELAEVLSLKGQTLLDRQTGLGLKLRIVERVPERAEAVRREKRQLQWKQMAWLELSSERGDGAMLRDMLDHYRRGLGEFDVQQLLLQQAGVALQPPSDWEPSSSRRPQGMN